MHRTTLFLTLAVAFAPALPRTARAEESPPDITGVWMIKPPYQLGKPLLPAPKVTPAVAAQNAKRRAAQQAGYVREAAGMLCGQNGGPVMYQVRSPFEIFSGFGRMTFIFETEMNNQPRTIYLEQAVQPPDLYPSYNGHSIGHWEGQTLVVETDGFVRRGMLLAGVPRTETTHTVERLALSADGATLTDQITVIDPAFLEEPWTTTLAFDRKPNTEQRFEVWCDADLEAFNRLDLKALKDVDPEIARLLDGSDTDPAVVIAKAHEAAKK
jgi:hypothetical protein